jgi:hypothetical protein
MPGSVAALQCLAGDQLAVLRITGICWKDYTQTCLAEVALKKAFRFKERLLQTFHTLDIYSHDCARPSTLRYLVTNLLPHASGARET